MERPTRPAKSPLLWTAVVIMLILHQDLWFWDSEQLVFGFLPVGLAYHMGFSVASACLWAWAILAAWPRHVEVLGEEPEA